MESSPGAGTDYAIYYEDEIPSGVSMNNDNIPSGLSMNDDNIPSGVSMNDGNTTCLSSPWFTNINSMSIIQNINQMDNNSNNDPDIIKLINIKHNLMNTMKDKFENEIEKTDEIKSHEDKIIKSQEIIKETMISFHKQQELVIQIEKSYKKELDKTKEDVDKMKTFSDFIIKMKTKYSDIDMNNITNDIIQLAQKIKDDNNCKKLRDEYQKELYILHFKAEYSFI